MSISDRFKKNIFEDPFKPTEQKKPPAKPPTRAENSVAKIVKNVSAPPAQDITRRQNQAKNEIQARRGGKSIAQKHKETPGTWENAVHNGRKALGITEGSDEDKALKSLLWTTINQSPDKLKNGKTTDGAAVVKVYKLMRLAKQGDQSAQKEIKDRIESHIVQRTARETFDPSQLPFSGWEEAQRTQGPVKLTQDYGVDENGKPKYKKGQTIGFDEANAIVTQLSGRNTPVQAYTEDKQALDARGQMNGFAGMSVADQEKQLASAKQGLSDMVSSVGTQTMGKLPGLVGEHFTQGSKFIGDVVADTAFAPLKLGQAAADDRMTPAERVLLGAEAISDMIPAFGDLLIGSAIKGVGAVGKEMGLLLQTMKEVKKVTPEAFVAIEKAARAAGVENSYLLAKQVREAEQTGKLGEIKDAVAKFTPSEDLNYQGGKTPSLVGMAQNKILSQYDNFETHLPMAGEEVSGLKVRADVPNMDSIGASLNEGTEASGIREVPMEMFQGSGPPQFLNNAERIRTEKLADEIRASGEINPLIIVFDHNGPYILEGGHRFDALNILGVDSFPAKVVYDEEAIYDLIEEMLKDGKYVPESLLKQYPDLFKKYPDNAKNEWVDATGANSTKSQLPDANASNAESVIPIPKGTNNAQMIEEIQNTNLIPENVRQVGDPSPGKVENLYHGGVSGINKLSVSSSGRNLDNATSRFGAFSTPDITEAERYAKMHGENGEVYSVENNLKNPFNMPLSEFNYYQAIERSAPDADGFARRVEPDEWANRSKELMAEVDARKAQLMSQGYDGIIVKGTGARPTEYIHFSDTNVTPNISKGSPPIVDNPGIKAAKPAVETPAQSPQNVVEPDLELVTDAVNQLPKDYWDRNLERIAELEQKTKMGPRPGGRQGGYVSIVNRDDFELAVRRALDAVRRGTITMADWVSKNIAPNDQMRFLHHPAVVSLGAHPLEANRLKGAAVADLDGLLSGDTIQVAFTISDHARTGSVRLPSGATIKMFGGPGFRMAGVDNFYGDGVGWAGERGAGSTQLGKARRGAEVQISVSQKRENTLNSHGNIIISGEVRHAVDTASLTDREIVDHFNRTVDLYNATTLGKKNPVPHVKTASQITTQFLDTHLTKFPQRGQFTKQFYARNRGSAVRNPYGTDWVGIVDATSEPGVADRLVADPMNLLRIDGKGNIVTSRHPIYRQGVPGANFGIVPNNNITDLVPELSHEAGSSLAKLGKTNPTDSEVRAAVRYAIERPPTAAKGGLSDKGVYTVKTERLVEFLSGKSDSISAKIAELEKTVGPGIRQSRNRGATLGPDDYQLLALKAMKSVIDGAKSITQAVDDILREYGLASTNRKGVLDAIEKEVSSYDRAASTVGTPKPPQSVKPKVESPKLTETPTPESVKPKVDAPNAPKAEIPPPKKVEAPKVAEAPQVKAGGPIATGLANQVQEREAIDGVLNKIDSVKGKTAEELHAMGRESGVTTSAATKLAEDIATGDVALTPENIGKLLEGKRLKLNEIADLRAKAAKDPGKYSEALFDAEAELQTYLDNVQSGKGQWSDMGRALQVGTTLEYGNIEDVLAKAKASGKEVSEKVAAALKKQSDDWAKAEADHQAKIAELQREKAKEAISTARRSAKPAKVEALRKERADLLNEFKNLRNTSAGVGSRKNKGAASKITAEDLKFAKDQAIIVKRIAENIIREGAVHIEDVILKVKLAFKDIDIDLEDQAVIDAMATAEKGATKSELAERLAALRKQARGMSSDVKEAQYQAMRDRVSTKEFRENNATWKKKFKLDQEIKDLETQLKDGRYRIPQKKSIKEQKIDQDILDAQARKRVAQQRIDNAIRDQYRSKTEKIAQGVRDLIQGTILGSDFGVLGRQGLFAWGGGIKDIPAALKNTAISIRRGEKGMAQVEHTIETAKFNGRALDPIRRKAGLSLTTGGGRSEELAFSRLIKHIPVIGEVIGGSLERGQSAFINTIRAGMFDRAVRAGFSESELAMRARFINNVTGRGNVAPNKFFRDILTSPRYEASRWGTIGEVFRNPTRLAVDFATGKGLNKAAATNLRDLTATAGEVFVVAGALVTFGGYEWDNAADPTSSDFLKLRKGDEVYDLTAGLGPRMRDIMRLVIYASTGNGKSIGTAGKAALRPISPVIMTFVEQGARKTQKDLMGVDEAEIKNTFGFESDPEEVQGILAFAPLILQSFIENERKVQGGKSTRDVTARQVGAEAVGFGAMSYPKNTDKTDLELLIERVQRNLRNKAYQERKKKSGK